MTNKHADLIKQAIEIQRDLVTRCRAAKNELDKLIPEGGEVSSISSRLTWGIANALLSIDQLCKVADALESESAAVPVGLSLELDAAAKSDLRLLIEQYGKAEHEQDDGHALYLLKEIDGYFVDSIAAVQESSEFDADHWAELYRLRAAGAAQPVSAGVLEGWKLVPVEPTDAMALAACKVSLRNPAINGVDQYRAMLAAAPQPPAPSEADHGIVP
jgi:hypothetical protein